MNEKKKILLVLSSERDWERCASTAIENAIKKPSDLYILYVLEEKGTFYLNKMSETEFMSKKTSTELSEALLREKRQVAYSAIEKIKSDANNRGIKVKSNVIAGDIFQLTVKFAKEINPDEIVLSWSKEGYIKRLFKGEPIENLEKATGLPITVINE